MKMGQEKFTISSLIVEYRYKLNKALEIYEVLKMRGSSEEALETIRKGAQMFATLCDLFIRLQRSYERRK